MQLHFKESGQGRAVVLLHGLFGSSDNWHFIAQRLAEKFHVFALDQRGHGQSPHAAEMNYPLMAADVGKFFSARGLKSAAVIGHSMGGKTAMLFALQLRSAWKGSWWRTWRPVNTLQHTIKFSPRCWRWICRSSRTASKSRTRWQRIFPAWCCADFC